MLIALRNIVVNIMALFISDNNARQKFRRKYKLKSKFRKLQDNNQIIIDKINSIHSDIKILNDDVSKIKKIAMSKNLLKPLDDPFEDYISIACIAKNEAPYIKEWIEYHKIVGIDKIYFYDNESTDNTKEVLAQYIKDGLVKYRYTPGKAMQNPVYQDAVLQAKNKTRWLALIDLDEFIVPNEKNNLKDFLKDYETYPGLGINWVMFDCNGHDTKPKQFGGLVTANYTIVRKNYNYHIMENGKYKIIANLHIKSIVNPREVVDITNPHFAFYRNGKLAVTENCDPIYINPTWQGQTKFFSGNKIQINHYYSKSREEYMLKVKKGRATCMQQKQFNETMLTFEQDTTHDNAIKKYIPELMRSMGIQD